MHTLRQLAESRKKLEAKEAKNAEKRLVATIRDAVAFVGVPTTVTEGALVEALSRMVADIAEFSAAGNRRIATLETNVAKPAER